MKISFIILSYNNVDTIEYAIKSILYSSIPKDDYEIIVVDDGSTDNTIKVLEKYNVSAYHTSNGKNTKNQSLGRNIGIRNSKAKYIRFIDGDDYLNSVSIGQEYSALDNLDIYFVKRINSSFDSIDVNSVSKTFAGISNYYIRREYIVENNLYFDEIKYNWFGEDVYFFTRIIGNTEKIDTLDFQWSYHAKKREESNSNFNLYNTIELIDMLGYYEEMTNDMLDGIESNYANYIGNDISERMAVHVLDRYSKSKK